MFGPAALPSLLGKSAREICVVLGFGEVRECVLGTARDWRWQDGADWHARFFSHPSLASSCLRVQRGVFCALGEFSCVRARVVADSSASFRACVRANQEWIDASLAKGKRFKLAIFPSAMADARQATWDGVEHLLRRVYPEVWESKVERHFATIRRTPISDIEAQAGYDMLKVAAHERTQIRRGTPTHAHTSYMHESDWCQLESA